MALDNVEPIGGQWKRNATAAERLEELALMARKDPDRFHQMLVIFQSEANERGAIKLNWADVGIGECATPRDYDAYYQRAFGLLEKFRIKMANRFSGIDT